MLSYGDKQIDLHIIMHYITQNNYFSLSKEFQKHLSRKHMKHGVLDQGRRKIQ